MKSRKKGYLTNGRIFRSVLITVFMILGSSSMVLAAMASFPEYNPLTLGSHWTYQNAADPFDTYTVSVFESGSYAGTPYVKYGTDANNCAIVYNNGSSVTIYGTVQNGVLYLNNPVTISSITDGLFYQLGEPFNYNLIRIWDNLDPILKAAYNIDPSLQDLMFIAAYDSRYPRNSQNDVVESNLAVSLPNYAATHLEWYKAGVGMITTTDVDAATGVIGARYDLIDYYIAPVPEPSTVFLLSAGLGGILLWRRKQ